MYLAKTIFLGLKKMNPIPVRNLFKDPRATCKKFDMMKWDAVVKFYIPR